MSKDSILFKQTEFFGSALYNNDDDRGMGNQVFENLKPFCRNKKRTGEVLDAINPTTLNAHFNVFMNGLTGKVCRTDNACKRLQEELRKHVSGCSL